jgi:hypothetical protein
MDMSESFCAFCHAADFDFEPSTEPSTILNRRCHQYNNCSNHAFTSRLEPEERARATGV